MPSLHFATSVMAAHVLADTGALAGAAGWTYALTLGFALVYLGEHYLIDLLAGLTLTEAVRYLGPYATAGFNRLSRSVQALEARAHA
jgi:membrane-associated phospholipid phosphatase